MYALCRPRRSCSCLPLESTAGRIGSLGGDNAETDHQEDMLADSGCRIYFNMSEFLDSDCIMTLTFRTLWGPRIFSHPENVNADHNLDNRFGPRLCC